ncbi:MAG: hypothetical protein AAB131_15740, partial [Actinomycetota bacterium]
MINIDNLLKDLDKEIPTYLPLRNFTLARIEKDSGLYKISITDSIKNSVDYNFIDKRVLTEQEFREFFKENYESINDKILV